MREEDEGAKWKMGEVEEVVKSMLYSGMRLI